MDQMLWLFACTLTAADLPTPELLGHFDPSAHAGFTRVAGPHWLRREAAAAFTRMAAAAQKDGLTLNILAATRNFASQKSIWERKWNALTGPPEQRATEILRFSSMPGTSRHHWGTDLDLNRLNAAWFRTGEGLRVYRWLVANAAAYGFCQPYGPKDQDRPHGYEEEPWHWSYRPLASDYLHQYRQRIRNSDLTGFTGSATAAAVQAIAHYVDGIAPACR